MFWTIGAGVLCFILGFFIGVNAGHRVAIKDGLVGYYDIGDSGKVFFDPKVKMDDIYNSDYIVLECVDLTNPINAKEK